MNSWEETLAKLVELEVQSRPETGQVWSLREDATLRKLLDPENKLPKQVVVASVDPPSWGKFLLKVRVVNNDCEMEIDCFETLYELYRPSLWERVSQRT